MRHRKSGRKFGMDATARQAMFRNMVTSVLVHGQVETTLERAKELRKFVERVITLGKRAASVVSLDSMGADERANASSGRVHLIRQARYWVNDREALQKVFGEYAERYATRPGGYTRVVKTRQRNGDNSTMASIRLVD